MVDTPWIQDYENQRAMLDGFAEQLAPQQSLVFFYAKQTPLSDSTHSPIVAVDQGLYSGGAVKGSWPLPDEIKINIDEADDPLRLRAATVAILADSAQCGDSLLSAAALGIAAQKLPLSPAVAIDDVVLELCEDDFAPAVRIYEIDDQRFAQLEHYEDCGTCIRGAIEARLAIRYSYEKPLVLDGKERWPDFTIEAGADVWYWEHCGMLGDPSYARRWHAKLSAYAHEGIMPWSPETPSGRLVITEDGPDRGLDSAALHAMARTLWS